MLAYRVTGDIKEIEQHLSATERRHIPFATALSLTRTAQFIAKKEQEEIGRVFDRPTPFARNSLFVWPATKQRLYAEVKIKDEGTMVVKPIMFLKAQIYGGQRERKRFEVALIRHRKMPPNAFAIPAVGADIDQYGNMSRGQLQQILSDLQARFDPRQNTTAASRGRRLRARTRSTTYYFSTFPPSKQTAHLRPGIYVRRKFGWGVKGTTILPVLIFTTKARYRKRFDFFRIAEQTGRMRWPIEFKLALMHALRTAR